ncbi:hypothetical protein [Clostridium akagii]|uniref:hypothetical protein n=1 Tax=Clostridium akagii TaxID=91623 RepID=UPI000A0464A6|nr:hypothetical protein [Clostridium akagii]
MIPEYCKQCINRNANPYMSSEFDANPTPHSSVIAANPVVQPQMQTGQTVSAPNTSADEDQFIVAPGSPTVLGIEYTQGFLKTMIGRRVRVTFLIGTDSLTDRTGILQEVGISFIVLRDTNSNLNTLCDIYSIKFVVIFN